MGTFYTDVIQPSPLYARPHRVASLDLLAPTFRQQVQGIIADAAAHGRILLVLETYRSQARQHQFFLAGASKLDAVGVHHYGLAADIVYLAAGELSWKGDFDFLGQLARANHLHLGWQLGLPATPARLRGFRPRAVVHRGPAGGAVSGRVVPGGRLRPLRGAVKKAGPLVLAD